MDHVVVEEGFNNGTSFSNYIMIHNKLTFFANIWGTLASF